MIRRRTGRGLPLAAATTFTILVAGCGNTTADGGAVVSQVLSADVARLDAAAHTGSRTAILGAAAVLRADLAIQQRLGRLTPARASEVLAQVARVVADTGADQPLPTPSPSPTPQQGDTKPSKGGDGGGGGGD